MEADGKEYLHLAEYQKWVAEGISPHVYSHDAHMQGAWSVMGLAAECGEVVELIEKAIRKNQAADPEKIKDELGDVLWYIAACAYMFQIDLNDILEHNISKLNARRYKTLEEIA